MNKMKRKGFMATLAILTVMGLLLTACGAPQDAATTAAATTAAATTTAAAATEAATTAAAGADATTAADADATTAAVTTAAAADTTTAPAASEYTEHLTFTLDVLDAEKHGITEKSTFWNEKFNVSYEYIPVSWGDWLEKVRTWVATDDMPDIIRWDPKYEHSPMFKGWARQGAFRAYPTLEEMRERWPALAAIRDQQTSDDLMVTVDGNLYGWLKKRNPPEYMNRSNYIIIGYRRDWAKTVGLYKENDVYTWDEFKAILTAFSEQDPGGNGPGNTLGLVAETWCLPTSYMLSTGDPEFYKGYFFDTVNDKWTHIMLTEGMRDSVIFWNDFYAKGYMWKDQVVAGGNEGRDYFRAGRTGAFLSNWTLAGTQQTIDMMVQNGVIDSAEDVGFTSIYSDLKPNEIWYNGIEDFWSMWCLNHNLSDEKMERFLDMWVWADSEEGFNFRNYGIEGKDFTKSADGSITLNWQKDAAGNFVNPYGDAAFTEMEGPQLDPDFNKLASTRDDVWAEFEKMANFLQTTDDLRVSRVHNMQMYFEGENYLQYGDFKADMDAAIINVMTSSTNPGADWDAWLETMKPRVQVVLDELEASDLPRENTW